MQGILDGEKPPDEEIVWLAHAGITTRSITDTAIVLDVLAERDGHRRASFVSELTREKPLRIGVTDNCKAGREVMDAFERAIDTIRAPGYTVSNAPVPFTSFTKGIADIASDRKAIARQSFDNIDVLLLPTTLTSPLTIKEADKPLSLSPENTMFANYYGLPAISVPCGFDRHGLPLGLQIVAKPWDEGAVLRLAHQFQTATVFGKEHPAE
jgi:aspartyl-tRNA(Asn)/glutamyl-tRNA(Gln) amidotransferase subunit A